MPPFRPNPPQGPCRRRFRRLRQPARTERRLAGALIPGALLALMPKCPLCLASWAAALGVALPLAAAGTIRHILIGACLFILLISLLSFLRSLLHNHQQHHARRNPAKSR